MQVHTPTVTGTDLRLGQDTRPHLSCQGSLSGRHRPASWPHIGHPHTGAPGPGKALYKHTIPVTRCNAMIREVMHLVPRKVIDGLPHTHIIRVSFELCSQCLLRLSRHYVEV